MRKLVFISLVAVLVLVVGSLIFKAFLMSGDSMPSGRSSSSLVDLPDFGPAPELKNEVWINSQAPLRLEDLRGKVVLLDMWTFG